MRQVHHWAALVFVAALIIHLLRMFLTAAYRRPRRINWLIGLGLLFLVGFNGLMGYSLPDDLLSGTGLRISYAITESIPFVGPSMASLLFGGEFPSGGIIARIYPVHIFLLPAAIAGLLGAAPRPSVAAAPHAVPGPGRSDRTIVGTPMVPAYALRTTGYLLLCAGVITAFGAFLQINPVWLYGPVQGVGRDDGRAAGLVHGMARGRGAPVPRLGHPDRGLPAAGRLLAGGDPARAHLHAAVPGAVDGLGGDARRRLPQRAPLPGQHPSRAALAAGFVTFLSVLLVAGGNDVFAVLYDWSQPTLLLVLQVLVIVLPPMVALLTYVLVRGRARRWASTVR